MIRSNPPQFGAWVKFNIPQPNFRYSYSNVNTANLRGLADVMDRQVEFNALVDAINDKADPLRIEVNVGGNNATAEIQTNCNGTDALQSNKDETLPDFLTRVLQAATTKAANSVSPAVKRQQREAKLKQVISDFTTALAAGTLQKVKDGENTYNSYYITIEARIGDKEYILEKKGLKYSDKTINIRFSEGDTHYCVGLDLTGGPEPPGLSSGRAPQPEKLSGFYIQEYNHKTSTNEQFRPTDKMDENTDPEVFMETVTLRNNAKNILKTLFESDMFPERPRY